MKHTLHIYSYELFQFSLMSYLVLLLYELVREGAVRQVFDLNYLLLVTLTCGIIAMITGSGTKTDDARPIRELDWWYIILISVGGGVLVWLQLSKLGMEHILVSLGTTVLNIVLSAVAFRSKR